MPAKSNNRSTHPGGGVAIIAGGGALPQLIADELRRKGVDYRIVIFDETELSWVADDPVIHATFEQLGNLIHEIKASGCSGVTFAGAMVRPHLDALPAGDAQTESTERLRKSLEGGDDETFRYFIDMFEDHGIDVIGAHEFLVDLVVQPGVLSRISPSSADKADAARAAEIVRAIGGVDVGQGAVVAQGICLGVESIQGTDTMLAFVAANSHGFRPNPDGARGVLYKAPKPGQDRRVDLPAIGARTMRAAADAGLAGVVVEAGATLILERSETIAEANRLGLFLWGQEGARG